MNMNTKDDKKVVKKPDEFRKLSQKIIIRPHPTILVQPTFDRDSTATYCSKCNEMVYTSPKCESGAGTWLIASGLCLIGCVIGCQFLPFCIDACKDVKHYCPKCETLLGVKKLI